MLVTLPQDEKSRRKSVKLFDGKSLEGWEGNEKSFRIEEGAIVGGTLKEKIPRNEFLATEKEYGDFELRLKFKLLRARGPTRACSSAASGFRIITR